VQIGDEISLITDYDYQQLELLCSTIDEDDRWTINLHRYPDFSADVHRLTHTGRERIHLP
jgi:hypothetical protein